MSCPMPSHGASITQPAILQSPDASPCCHHYVTLLHISSISHESQQATGVPGIVGEEDVYAGKEVRRVKATQQVDGVPGPLVRALHAVPHKHGKLADFAACGAVGGRWVRGVVCVACVAKTREAPRGTA